MASQVPHGNVFVPISHRGETNALARISHASHAVALGTTWIGVSELLCHFLVNRMRNDHTSFIMLITFVWYLWYLGDWQC